MGSGAAQANRLKIIRAATLFQRKHQILFHDRLTAIL